jgi:predicted phage terminase large subunit-like protein
MEPIWQERFPPDECERLKLQLPAFIYACQWMNNPVSPEEAVFRMEDIKRCWERDLHNKMLNNFMSVDWALTDKEYSDYTAMTVCSFDPTGALYVREIYRERSTDLDAHIETAFKLVKKWNCIRAGVEAEAFQEAVIKNYKKMAMSRGLYIPWHEIKRKRKSKYSRWISMQPLVQNGNFYIVEGIANAEWLIEEMTSLTPDHMPAHDDVLDTVSDCFQMSYAAALPETPERAPDSADAIMDDLFGPMFDNADEPELAWVGEWED